MDVPDPFAPSPPAVTGAVASMSFSLPPFFVASSAIGLTVRTLTFDASQQFTPADIMARNQGPDWTGLAINEALVYLARNTPLVGSMVLGMRDVLLGDPFGMQGELYVEWGAAIDVTTVEVRQATDASSGTFTKITVVANAGELDRTIVFDPDRPLRFFAQVTTTDADARWVLPDGSKADGVVTPEFRARAGDTLICVRREKADDGSLVDLPEIRHHFAATPAVAPQIQLTCNGRRFANTVNVSGSRDTIAAAALTFTATPLPANPDVLTWQLGNGPTAAIGDGATFSLGDASRLPDTGSTDLVLSDDAGRQRRVRIETLRDAALLVLSKNSIDISTTRPEFR